MSSDVLSNFSCLDELIQVVYQGVSKFVVLSNVTDDQWKVHVGLIGAQGRWWHGAWGSEDVHQIVGPKASDKILEALAEKLAECIIQGNVCIGDWSPQLGAKINLTLGPTSKKPLQIPLIELIAVDAAAYAASVFFEIGLQAQSRKSRLHPAAYSSSFTLPSSTLPSTTTTTSGILYSSSTTLVSQFPAPFTREFIASTSATSSRPVKALPSSSRVVPPADGGIGADSTATAVKKAQAEIESLKAELDHQKLARQRAEAGTPERKVVPAQPRPMKGASLANPNKKARKYQAIEFGSEDE